ncbi:hypothetical protein A2715_04730 [Candidatus Woesebacteria bacterium RIFCSPHIGHO2_01_FULL_39_32]|uniref:Glycosyltransferase RgtA/B/C/D-like domain-containing protein n=1 Tax=Candidatus Woesebacteria bacterium RIFCSPLOWO2_01_FULL_39_25 TaxID=1802521 RepID=A0A1F8BLA9_9BACT|nr:MAG: hypothetical protein A2715_04730 [Candidatus Woesebacteria bacterium RIFCSPHIGHO2_01_FULL_39_32]OGM37822.1 MAG: hypothetical protein A3F01_01940 [Candidatus Woesebacteria bacterium RIFCSPHIGHO2_12_FULL_38_11]OGM64854.1 MAG: hypothetical protein A2893_04340 [Candidatus Woesebacteria bacterium RIFCSPLOWO2_01_FULL_39_25]
MNIRNFVIFVIPLGILFWPLSLFLANTPSDFLSYFLPVIFILLSFLIYKKQWNFYQIPILFIPIVEPKLTLFPVVFLLTDLIFGHREKTKIIFLIISTILLFVFWKPLWGQTIFIKDYEARQEVIRDTQLYPSIFLARTFHNKARIIVDKFIFNFFALTDPNNYFFGFAPRQIVNNQNLVKFPFFAIVFVFYGLFFIRKAENKKFITLVFLSSIISLSILSIFDRNDFVLWIPMALLFIHGVNLFTKKYKFSFWILVLFIIFTIPELLRIVLQYSR